ncbi:MAG: NifB/NifX family molybdenum-iron cluster-binding protein [Candidatus Woesearchaeota archaeon]
MRIAITADGEKLHSKVDQRFGRCPYFIVLDINGDEVGTFEAIKNEGAIQGHGAGIKAAEQMGELKVDMVITGQLGPNSTSVLEKLGIKVYSASGVITDVLNDFIKNKLKQINEVAEAHARSTSTEFPSEKIFFPLLNDRDLDSEISEHFGHAPFFGLYDVNKKDLTIIPNDLDHTNPNSSPIDQIEKAVNPTTIFAKSIGGRAIGLIQEKGLRLKTGNYDTVKEVVENLDKLEDQTQDCGHRH